jgi:predicted tellurium resistance membrane protein TerC
MDWLFDPTAWVGLVTLVVLEIVLGVDNLIFIAIITDKLPPEQRSRARLIGLSLALGMRLALLASISWIVTLTRPLFTIAGFGVSGRQLILIVGGLFLIWKATTELHERLEGASERRSGPSRHASFWQIVAQIVVLDAVFSLDSVITAVGMVDELGVMMTAVVIAVILMMVASRPLMDFVSAHPTVVILCLGFLLMIGFSLGAEGLGFHIPKSYLYAAIAFSILIEIFNQIALRNRRRKVTSGDLRQRTADAVLRLLGAREVEPATPEDVAAIAAGNPEKVFAPEERQMIAGVLDLANREVHSVMTPADKIVWLDRDEPESELRRRILQATHTRYPIARGGLDNLTGVALTQELLCGLLNEGRLSLSGREREPLVVPKDTSVLDLVQRLRDSPVQMALVKGDSGQVEGIVTPMDVLEAIVGDLPDEGEARAPHEQPA